MTGAGEDATGAHFGAFHHWHSTAGRAAAGSRQVTSAASVTATSAVLVGQARQSTDRFPSKRPIHRVERDPGSSAGWRGVSDRWIL